MCVCVCVVVLADERRVFCSTAYMRRVLSYYCVDAGWHGGRRKYGRDLGCATGLQNGMGDGTDRDLNL